jgi:hypothetical protein
MKQSFNVDNFIKIFYDENRKGNYLEGDFTIFKPLKEISQKIKQINKNFIIGTYSTEQLKIKANSTKEKLQKKKFEKLIKILKVVEANIDSKAYELVMATTTVKGKIAYTVERNNAEVFFLLKQIQRNIQHSFNVIQSDRHEVVTQVINMLDNSFPKFIIRTDIKSFFESIPHDKLKETLTRNHILSPQSKKIINEILRQYKILTGHDHGIPRGIGISAYLAELYMRDIDKEIRALSNVTYYARYVDDMILVFTPNTKYDDKNYLNGLKSIIEKYILELNDKKTKEIDFYNMSDFLLDFLGYSIEFKHIKKNEYNFFVRLSHSKKKKYYMKVKLLIEEYNLQSKFNEKEARKLLVKRLKYLTGNTRLLGVKKDILVGTYFSNQLVSEISVFKQFDDYLQALIDKKVAPYSRLTYINTNHLKTKLKKFSFSDGFTSKKFYKFSKIDLENILNIWKSL